MSDASQMVSQLLVDLREGDESAMDRLISLVYDDLRAIARGVQRGQAHSLNPTALVHEAYARLLRAGNHDGYDGRLHFMRVAAIAMRQLLADHARERNAQKRGGGVAHVTLHSSDAVDGADELDLVELDQALSRLAAAFPRQAKVVELRFLAGLTVDDAARVLDVSPRTIKVDWQLARAWLSRELGPTRDGGRGE